MSRACMPFSAPVQNDLVDREIFQTPGEIFPGWQAPRGAVRRSGPSRLAIYHQNWSGERTWQTWSDLDFPLHTRTQIHGQNVQAFALNTLARVQAPGTAPRPIPLADYTLQTRMNYVGTIDQNGRIMQ